MFYKILNPSFTINFSLAGPKNLYEIIKRRMLIEDINEVKEKIKEDKNFPHGEQLVTLLEEYWESNSLINIKPQGIEAPGYYPLKIIDVDISNLL